MSKTTTVFNLGELFCGPGGLALGATTARIDNPDYKIVHAWANDYDESTCKTYVRNICPFIYSERPTSYPKYLFEIAANVPSATISSIAS